MTYDLTLFYSSSNIVGTYSLSYKLLYNLNLRAPLYASRDLSVNIIILGPVVVLIGCKPLITEELLDELLD